MPSRAGTCAADSAAAGSHSPYMPGAARPRRRPSVSATSSIVGRRRTGAAARRLPHSVYLRLTSATAARCASLDYRWRADAAGRATYGGGFGASTTAPRGLGRALRLPPRGTARPPVPDDPRDLPHQRRGTRAAARAKLARLRFVRIGPSPAGTIGAGRATRPPHGLGTSIGGIPANRVDVGPSAPTPAVTARLARGGHEADSRSSSIGSGRPELRTRVLQARSPGERASGSQARRRPGGGQGWG